MKKRRRVIQVRKEKKAFEGYDRLREEEYHRDKAAPVSQVPTLEFIVWIVIVDCFRDFVRKKFNSGNFFATLKVYTGCTIKVAVIYIKWCNLSEADFIRIVMNRYIYKCKEDRICI